MKKNSSLNHTYRLVWNDASHSWVAVPETARGRGKRGGRARLAVLAAALLSATSLPAWALDATALPSAGKIVAGQASLAQQGARLDVRQSSDRLIMDWSRFDIGSQAHVDFIQPGASSVALNRVSGGQASAIFGRLTANGQVWLLNPQGVVFGRSAQVDVAGLVAGSLGMSDDDFLAGRMRLQAGASAGAVRNDGQLRAREGGVIALIGPSVSQQGSISAPAGSVLLGAGEQVSMDFNGDGLLQLSVERGALEAHIDHGGQISAHGGVVQLSARSASALRASVVNSTGIIEAQGLSAQGGRILLDGGDSGAVQLGGRLDATASAGTGGDISVTAGSVQVQGATLDASGAQGGGWIRVGGGWQGQDRDLANARNVTADAATVARANATDSGHGGRIVFWSDERTAFAGQLQAQGGARSGDGGQMEVSGLKELAYTGRADARAAQGRTGDLLLDPATIDIVVGAAVGNVGGSTVTVADLEAQNANVLLEATGNATIGDLSANGGNGKLTMAPNVSLRIEAGTSGSGNLIFSNPANTVEVSGTGSIMFVAGETGSGQLLNIGNLSASGAGSNPGMLPVHDVSVLGSGTPSAGSITLFGADGITVGGTLSTNGGYVRIWGDSDNASGGGLTLAQPIATNGGHLHLSTGTSAINMNGSMTLGAGRIFFRSDGSHSTGTKVLGGVLSASGNVDINTAFQMNAGASILTDGVISLSSTVNLNTGAGTLTLRGSQIDFTGATLQNLSTASMRLEPADPATNMILGDAAGFASASTLAALPGIKNLTIGRADGTGTVSVPGGGFSFDANGTLEVVNQTVDISGGSLINTNGSVTITGDNINIAQTVSANGGAGKVTLRQQTASNTLNLGGGLSNASVGNISAAILAVGRADGGDLVFDNDISTTAGSVHLLSGNRVLGVNGGVSASNLAITAGTGAVISDATFDFSTLAASLGGSGGQTSSITSSAGTWGLGTVDGLSGLLVQSGAAPTITLSASTQLQANAAINFNSQAATLNLRAPAIASASASVSNRSAATVSFDRLGAGAWDFGGAGANVTAASLAAFNGTGFIQLGSATTDLTATGAVSLSVGDTFTVQGNTVAGLSGGNHIAVTSGNMKLDAEAGALALQSNLNVAGRLVLETSGSHGIGGSGVITANSLALRASGGAVALSDSTHQIATLAAQVDDLALRNGRALAVGTVDGLAGVQSANTVDLRLSGASSDLTLNNGVTAQSGTGAALQLVSGRHFINNAGAGALSAPSGLWRVYSTHPANDTRGGLAPDFKQYAATPASTVLGTGNGLLYSVAPTITVGLTGSVSKVYDGTTSASLAAGNFSLSGVIDSDSIAISGGTRSFDTRDAGTGKTVTASGYTLAASQATAPVYGYQFNSSASAAIGTISPLALTPAAPTGITKVYDGTTAAALPSGLLTGLVSGDDVVVNGSGQYLTPDAGTGKTVNYTFSLAGDDAGNYSLTSGSLSTTGAITPRQLSMGPSTVISKVYDGNTLANVSVGELSGLLAGDSVTLGADGSYADKNAGLGKPVTIVLTLSGADAGNYTLGSGTQSALGDITPLQINAGASTVAAKVYDGSAVANVGAGALSGVVGGDSVTLTAGGNYADKNVGVGKTVTIDLKLSGPDAGNYTLDSASQTALGDITARPINAGAATVTAKAYDGTTTANVNVDAAGGLVAGDSVSLGVIGSYADKNVGTGKAVTILLNLSGADAGNYTLTSGSVLTTGDITPRLIDAGAATVAAKVYDGSTAAQVSGGGLSGVLAGDNLTLATSGSFADKNAGLGKTVTIVLNLSGADAGNYALASASQTALGDITPRQVNAGASTVTAKVYDGSTAANVNAGAVSGLLAGDSVTLGADGSYADKNAGLGKTVTIMLNLSGADAGNYSLASAVQSALGDITPRQVNAGASTVTAKVYDGNTVANVNAGALSGLVAGDSVTLGASGSYADKNAGVGKTVTIVLNLSGADAGNYRLASAGQSAMGDIGPRSVNLGSVVIAPKIFDGAVDASVEQVVLSGVLPGEDVGADVRAQFADPAAGQGKPVQVVSASLRGADAGNYRLQPGAPSTQGDILLAPGKAAVDSVAARGAGGNSTGAGSAGSAGGAGAGSGTSSGSGSGAGAGTSGTAGGAAGAGGASGPAGSALLATSASDASARGPGASPNAGANGASGPVGFSMEQVLSGRGQVSVAMDAPVLAAPVVANVQVVRAGVQSPAAATYVLTDMGASISLVPSAGALPASVPRAVATGGLAGQTQVSLQTGGSLDLSYRLSDDGTLRARLPAAADGMGDDVLSLLVLGALKREHGAALDQVLRVVLEFEPR